MRTDARETVEEAFRAEATELLAELGAALLTLETNPGDSEYLHHVCRVIHTIKGSAATAGRRRLSAFAHRVEEVFALVRAGGLTITAELMDCALKACDVMSAILNAENPDADSPGERIVLNAIAAVRLKHSLQPGLEDEIACLAKSQPATSLSAIISVDTLAMFLIECQEHLDTLEGHTLHLAGDHSSKGSLDALFRAVHTIKGSAGLLLAEFPSASLTNDHPLPRLAAIAHSVESVLDICRQGSAPTIDAETIRLVLEARDSMHALLKNLSRDARHFTGPRQAASEPGALAFRNTAMQCLQLFENCLGQMENGHLSQSTLKTFQRGLKTLASAVARRKQSGLHEPVATQLRLVEALMKSGDAVSSGQVKQFRKCLSEISSAIDRVPADRPPISTSIRPPGKRTPNAAKAPTTIRIDQEKLDRLMRVVGELLVAKGAFPSIAERLEAGEDCSNITKALKDAGKNITHIADELQASVLMIRMLPVRSAFQRFPRLVHEMGRSMGKQVQLVIEGETTELDKTILEQIGDPLTHLIRNALDHGLESPQERIANGKPSAGQLTLRARNEGGGVTIEVEDDGRGLDTEALKEKAVHRGLITPEAALTMRDAEAYRLVFLPGLSTAEKVTDVSGRGVGMDVVQSNIRSLQGTVEIRGDRGCGTVFSIKLPTSLMVCKGILLEAGGQEYILPLTSIRDMVKVQAAQVCEYGRRRIAQVRGEIYPVFSLAEMFDLPSTSAAELPIAVVECGRVRYGLIAERFVSQVEVLVKPLGGGLEHHKEFHGAAIMSDGRVVLVLNPVECHRLEASAAA